MITPKTVRARTRRGALQNQRDYLYDASDEFAQNRIQAEHPTQASRPRLVFANKEKTFCKVVDVAVRANHTLEKDGNWKVEKCEDLARELKRLLNMKLGRANKSDAFNDSDALENPYYALSVVGSGEIKKINGVLVDVQDDCHPGKKDSCKPGFCCVKEVIAYRPQYKGQKAAYKLACKRMRREGEFCMPEDVLHICPCNKGFECHAEKEMDYGHCRRMKKPNNKSVKMGIGI